MQNKETCTDAQVEQSPSRTLYQGRPGKTVSKQPCLGQRSLKRRVCSVAALADERTNVTALPMVPISVLRVEISAIKTAIFRSDRL
jgi:hypothetical protein